VQITAVKSYEEKKNTVTSSAVTAPSENGRL